jgi:hypothetical protein
MQLVSNNFFGLEKNNMICPDKLRRLCVDRFCENINIAVDLGTEAAIIFLENVIRKLTASVTKAFCYGWQESQGWWF